jgi:hypothetical protein
MPIYPNLPKRKINYRKIYEQHYGPIPKDAQGRSYQIHHIDGNHCNNNIENLACLSIEDHYQLHLSNQEYAAARLLALQMNRSREEISELSRKTVTKTNQRMIQDGTHPWLGPDHNKKKNAKAIANGTHPWLGPENNRRRIENGTHPFKNSEIQSRIAKNSVANGKNALVGGEIQRKTNARLLAEGKHVSQIKQVCEHCGKTISKTNYHRWHGDRCKVKNLFVVPECLESWKP